MFDGAERGSNLRERHFFSSLHARRRLPGLTGAAVRAVSRTILLLWQLTISRPKRKSWQSQTITKPESKENSPENRVSRRSSTVRALAGGARTPVRRPKHLRMARTRAKPRRAAVKLRRLGCPSAAPAGRRPTIRSGGADCSPWRAAAPHDSTARHDLRQPLSGCQTAVLGSKLHFPAATLRNRRTVAASPRGSGGMALACY
jgi:hypothetical protein